MGENLKRMETRNWMNKTFWSLDYVECITSKSFKNGIIANRLPEFSLVTGLASCYFVSS